jgi:hypothetical protein
VTDVAHDGHVLDAAHVIDRQDVLVAGGRHNDVRPLYVIFKGDDLEAVHGGLKRADRIDFGDQHARACAGEGLGRALADIAIAAHDGDLAGEHHVGAAADRIHQRFPAAIFVVELRLGDAVIDIDRRERQFARSCS